MDIIIEAFDALRDLGKNDKDLRKWFKDVNGWVRKVGLTYFGLL